MKVSELANELGKSSKEILDVIKQKDNHGGELYASSSVSKAQEDIVRNSFNPKKEAPKADTSKTETSKGEPAKKKLTAVFRPQNAQQQIKRPASQKPQGGESVKSQGGESAQGENRRDSRQGNRDGRQGGYQGSRDGNREGRQGGYQGNRDGNREGRQGGYQGNRDGGRDGNREGRQGGYQGSRDGNREGRSGGYQGNRDGSRDGRQGGYQGNRDGNREGRQGGYQGNRDGNREGRQGGYQGSRDGRQGSRDGSRQGGSFGNRGGQGGSFGQRGQGGSFGRPGEDKDRDQRGAGRDNNRRSGGRDSKMSFDTPIQTKPTSSRQNKTAHKNDRFDKRDRVEDGKKKAPKTGKGAFIMPQPKKEEAKVEDVKTITLPETLTIKELADKMKLQPSVIVKKLFLKGQMVTLNQEIDYEQAEEIAMEFEVLCEKEEKIDVIAELLKEDEENEADMVPRSPVVCVMGHVDHGKTSLLDAIRQSNVTAREAGGITQHIGASVIEMNGRKITFLDTPGHEAFTAMRMRGAQSTDIAILVVAADDGVMPQTVEAINHAKAAGVEIIVAINKIDKPSANVDKVKQELSEYELIPEDWGGSTIFVPVSAHTREGITDLLEMVLLTADVLELKANPNRKGRGLVIEAELDKGKGPVATVLVQKGTLRVGETIAAGACYGKIRAMMDDKGRRVKEAGPSTPVEILGLNDVPNAGEVFVATENEKEARNFAETFISEGKNKLIEDTKAKLSLDDLFSQIKAGNVKELPLIVKADVQGSVEAVKQSLTKLSNEEVVVKVIHGGVGAINESDVSLASASNAIIIGFNIRPDATAKSIAEREKVDIRLYRVIYQAIEDVEAAMKGMLDPVFEEKVIGHAVIRQTFKASGVGTIAGSYVLDGKFQRGCSCRIKRAGEQIFEGPLASLKRFKDDVKEVAAGYECGLVFEKFNDLQEDDEIEAYIMVEVPR
ncbi:MAG: translation initiation factor IF-2 [Clostridiales bacterium]|uniref:translation initiation factor IF-2 n=1 Tax=Enterocloster sp. TaxID=2719315 RepID=UPI00174E6976|nr:translation initiation factor IF-2 [Clostridiales bacterium]